MCRCRRQASVRPGRIAWQCTPPQYRRHAARCRALRAGRGTGSGHERGCVRRRSFEMPQSRLAQDGPPWDGMSSAPTLRRSGKSGTAAPTSCACFKAPSGLRELCIVREGKAGRELQFGVGARASGFGVSRQTSDVGPRTPSFHSSICHPSGVAASLAKRPVRRPMMTRGKGLRSDARSLRSEV